MFGNRVSVVFKVSEFHPGGEAIFRNVTSFKFRGDSIAIDSEIHKAGICIPSRDIQSFTVTPDPEMWNGFDE